MKIIKFFLELILSCIVLGSIALFAGYHYLAADLPDVTELKDIRLQTPMQVLSAEGELIALYGERRRIPIAIKEMPPQLLQAVIATEDSRFYEHKGIDPVGILRAVFSAMRSGSVSQGASTITQQVAKNFFLTPEKKLIRKLREIILAIRIEQHLTKDEILELYLNKIYLGSRAYGVGAAAYTFFGKEVNQLTLSEVAMIAGLPKAPSNYNPIYANERALQRRNTVLWRMLDQKYITQEQYDEARNEPLIARYHEPEIAFSAPYLTEMVRQVMYNKYGEDAYNDGYKVYTTVTKPLQQAATQAVRQNVLDYDMRHGYRGAEKVLWSADETPWEQAKITEALKQYMTYNGIRAGVVTQINESNATVILANSEVVTLTFDGVRWARAFIDDKTQGPLPNAVSDVLKVGQQIWVRHDENRWWLAQVPSVNSALVSISPNDGAVKALVGGFDFNLSKFNRVTQSIRQVGSSIKPFIYAAALEKGLTMATLLNDAPIVRTNVGSEAWRPKNSPETYLGPTRLRIGLATSKNVMMVRAVRAIGINYAADFLQRFGFPDKNVMRTESLALGAASFTPLQLARGYAVFANDGYLVTPYFIQRIEQSNGGLIFQAEPEVACKNCDMPVIYGETAKERVKSAEQLENELLLDGLYNPNQDLPSESELSAEGAIEVPVIADELKTEESQTIRYAPHVISNELAFIMRDGLVANIWGEQGGNWRGTGWRARALQRKDIGGKTGTTNLSKDAWYSGFGPNIVTTVWIGFDNHSRELGRARQTLYAATTSEGGARTAQPAWNEFMKVALADEPIQIDTPPAGIVTAMIDRDSGKLSFAGGDSRLEYFIKGTEPTEYKISEVGTVITDEDGNSHELF